MMYKIYLTLLNKITYLMFISSIQSIKGNAFENTFKIYTEIANILEYQFPMPNLIQYLIKMSKINLESVFTTLSYICFCTFTILVVTKNSCTKRN